jgi:transposase-like protein
MAQLSYRRIGSRRRSSSTIWLYPRFTLSYRDVEDLLAKRGLDISHETGFAPKMFVTDKRRSYGSAFRHLRLTLPS